MQRLFLNRLCLTLALVSVVHASTAAVAADQTHRVHVSKPGVFHVPKKGAESKRFDVPLNKDIAFRRIVVELDVTPSGWNAVGGQKTNHAVFWLNRGQKWRGNVLGYVNLFGPTRPRVKMANNLKQKPGVMRNQAKAWTAEANTTYRFRYVYDTTKGQVELTVSKSGKELIRLSDKATVDVIAPTNPDTDNAPPGFFLVFGHPANSPGPEVPTYGWKYANLDVVFE